MVSWQILMLIVIFLVSISTIISKKTLFKEHAMEFAASISFVIAVLSLPLLFFSDFNFPITYWFFIYLVSLFSTIGFLLIVKATRHLDISLSSPLFAFAPIITAILAFNLIGEELTKIHFIGLSLVFLGSYFLEIQPKKSMLKEMLSPIEMMVKSKYIHFMLIALVLYGFGGVIQRFMLNTTNLNSITVPTFFSIVHIFIAINFLILLTVYHDGYHGIIHGIKFKGLPIMIIAIMVFAGRFLTTMAITIPAAQIALVESLKRGSTVLTTFFGGEIFKDKHLKQRTVAALVMVAGAILVAL